MKLNKGPKTRMAKNEYMQKKIEVYLKDKFNKT